jgi:hypothetical protein
MRRTIIVLACLAAIAAAAGCSSATDGKDISGRSADSATAAPPAEKPSDYPTETAAPETTKAGPKTFPMGYQATITDDEVGDTLHITVAQPRTVAGDEFTKPEKGRFLAVTVTYEALAEAQDINPYDLIVTTASGERLEPTFGPDAGTQLDSATLNRGEKAKGAVVFDVPKTGVVGVAYAPGGQILGTWKL